MHGDPEAVARLRSTSRGSRRPEHAARKDAERQARQRYRAAHFTRARRRARVEVLRRAGYRCQRIIGPGDRVCGRPATEVHELISISSAPTIEEAVAVASDPANMVAVCRKHNPRGRRNS